MSTGLARPTGIASLLSIRKLMRSLGVSSPPEVPRDWIEHHEPTPQQLYVQRDRMRRQHGGLNFGLLLVDFDASVEALGSTVSSLLDQTNPHWQLWILSRKNPCVFAELANNDHRIRVAAFPDNASRAAGLQHGLGLVEGDFVGLIDPGDQLASFALHDCAMYLHRHPEVELLYSDEDQVAPSGRRCQLRLKPSWSPSLLLGRNALGRLWLANRRSVTDIELGPINGLSAADLEWDLLLRITEAASGRIQRLCRCLYHRHSVHEEWETPNPEAAVRVVSGHLQRLGREVETVTASDGRPRAAVRLEKEPLVSVIIPTRDNLECISRCVDGLLHDTAYNHKEIVLVDNGSRQLEVLDYYSRLERDHAVTVVSFPRDFNYSAACNVGAERAEGQLLLFLNNDTEVIDESWMTELVRWATMPDVGVVGGKLLYPNGRVQHAGIALAGPGLTTHLFHGWKGTGDRLFGSPSDYRDCLAVTGACQMLRREVFDEIGGYDEEYALCYSDIAFCLDAIANGLRVMVTPHAVLRHYECQTRGYVDRRELEDARQFARLITARNLWQDPYLHPELELTHGTPVLRTFSEPSMELMLRDRVAELLVGANVAA